jgi:hypothetical protein
MIDLLVVSLLALLELEVVFGWPLDVYRIGSGVLGRDHVFHFPSSRSRIIFQIYTFVPPLRII